MTIGLQGTWNVSVKSKSAAFQQRFRISGSDNDGTHSGVTTTAAVLVTGDQWGVTIENNPTGPTGWRQSRTRLANFRTEAGFFKVDILSDDSPGQGGDEDFNDLILTASKPLNPAEWIVYGTVKTYTGRCLINPCFPYPWLVVDEPGKLKRLLAQDSVRPILERAYGNDVAKLAEAEHFRPLMLSTGGKAGTGLTVSGKTEAVTKGTGKKATLETSKTASLRVANQIEYAANLGVEEAQVFSPILRYRCETSLYTDAMMRFVEYDRTANELAGGVYTAGGGREVLGSSATDDVGNYVFSFTRTIAQLVDEALEDTPAGGVPATSANPDLIIQFPDEFGSDVAIYETAPYYDIANVRRIDLCIAARALLPKPCRGGNTIQWLGDMPIGNGGATLHPDDGTVTNTAASEGPLVTRAAWRGTVEVGGCFDGSTRPVQNYTIEYRVGPIGPFNYLSSGVSGQRKQPSGVYENESFGPTPTPLSVGTVSAYRNIEDEPNWNINVLHRKAFVSLASLLDPARPGERQIWFRIRGYDSSGNEVTNTEDEFTMRATTETSTGDIASIAVQGQPDPGDCALLELASDTATLNVRLRAEHVDGFMQSWKLRAVRGANVPLGQFATDSFPVASLSTPYRFYGTSDFTTSTPDLDGYVVLSISPPSGGWLGLEDFCAFSFELTVADRTTDGKRGSSQTVLWDEVVGMRRTSTP